MSEDADSMSDKYETKYCMATENFTCDPDSGIVYNEVNGQGWQHPSIHNARYAVLIGGGGTLPAGSDTMGNHPAFWNDAKEFYNKLVNGYKYVPENVYLMSSKWYVKHGNNYVWEGHDKTTDTIVDGECQWNNATSFDIKDAIEKIGEGITVNDFMILVSVAHGGPDAFSIVPIHTSVITT